MHDASPDYYRSPVFLFDRENQCGHIINPATGLVALEFPPQLADSASFPLHRDSDLSADFSRYLYYLVHQHILFTRPAAEELLVVAEEDPEQEEAEAEPADDDDSELCEFSALWYRATLDLPGLSGLYDRPGFCFLDGALYSAMYCDVTETPPRH